MHHNQKLYYILKTLVIDDVFRNVVIENVVIDIVVIENVVIDNVTSSKSALKKVEKYDRLMVLLLKLTSTNCYVTL